VPVDYVSKWVEALPCKKADNINSKKIFEEIIFPRFGVSRIVISDGGSHFIDKALSTTFLSMEYVTTLLPPIILRQVGKQKHQISKSRTFYRRQ
jgi:hypothetical protein